MGNTSTGIGLAIWAFCLPWGGLEAPSQWCVKTAIRVAPTHRSPGVQAQRIDGIGNHVSQISDHGVTIVGTVIAFIATTARPVVSVADQRS
jgi:hypothetical protein